MSDAISTTARARVDEIAQVEGNLLRWRPVKLLLLNLANVGTIVVDVALIAEIQALSISKAAQDRLYYDSTAQREANVRDWA
jgi:hypothetical protein